MIGKYFHTALLSVFVVLAVFANTWSAGPEPITCNSSQSSGQADAEKLKHSLEQAMKKENAPSAFVKESSARTVENGDLAKINYTVFLPTGEVVSTTDAAVAADNALPKTKWFKEPKEFVPDEILGGQVGVLSGLGDAVIGMASGERKKLSLSPDKAYGVADPTKKIRIPCTQTMSRTIRMKPEDYVQKFHAFPVVGKEVGVSPYFKAIIKEVGEDQASLECMAKDGERFEETFGTTVVKVEGQRVSVEVTPRLGAIFEANGKSGRIVSCEGDWFTVDFNNPLAGKSVVVDLQVVSLTKVSDLDAMKIEWVENHDGGLALAKQEGKPAVLVLYADWCGFCKRFFSESLQDPRVRVFKDRFVWIKVNSDANPGFKEMYGQNGFPLIVLLNSEGTVIHKIDGFRDAPAFREELIASSKAL